MMFDKIWVHEEIVDDIVWSFKVKTFLKHEKSQFQDVTLIETETQGKVLLLDSDVQSSEADEYVYHELLVHPALLNHPNPQNVFILGGGEGATAREVLQHKCVEKVVMVDIDEVVCKFCENNMEANAAAFADQRLELIYDDAGKILENTDNNKFDVIICDLPDVFCDQPYSWMYTTDFYERVVKSKLRNGGIFASQSGAAGVLSCGDIFSHVNKTLKAVFPRVVPYTQHVPSFSDEWGWNMAFTDPNQVPLSPDELDARIAERLGGDLKFLDGITWNSVSSLSKMVRCQLEKEIHVYTREGSYAKLSAKQ